MEELEHLVNQQLNNINLRITRRYNYFAIDICNKDGQVLTTLLAGLSGRQAYDILNAILSILCWEKTGGNKHESI